MPLSNREWLAGSLQLLTAGLAPVVGERVPGAPSDLPSLLRLITDGSAFSESLSKAEFGFANELLDTVTRLADTSTAFNDPDTQRVLDTTARLLRAVGAMPEAEAADSSLTEFLRVAAGRSRKADRASVILPGTEGLGLKPWREVIRPHQDIRDGNFNASQFAANLYNVVAGTATPEYRDPVEFFRRTYLTEGLKDLLSKAIWRVSGDMNAPPVINLQTNFGGGKTHSMLALYHVFSATPATEYPQGVQELADGIDLARLGSRTHRVVISGQNLSPRLGTTHDGVRVNTLWGEIAWQLGGRAAYERLAAADEAGTSPGREVLEEILVASSPCLILIDEWVAYARQLSSEPGSYGGTFDTQFSFAQLLTEAVGSVPGAMLAVTIPASDVEAGGSNGREALTRLQNLVRRVGNPWKAATAKESFEIVRRRLFEEVDAAGLAEIAAIARRFTQFYREHRGEFPSEAADADYEDDIRAAYPIHPELFQRLYDDWSALERFQRTRGVLALMSNAIQVLWDNKDGSPMIMPATVPLSAPGVGGQLAQYLEDSWGSVINKDVEGRDSTPAAVDRARPLYGQRSVTERLARTIFIGSAATLRSANKGIDKQRIWLGTAVPGDTTAHFESALHLLAERATYLYAEGDRYWYDVSQSVTKTVRDIADGLPPERIYQAICGRLKEAATRNRGNFVGFHTCFTETHEIPDDDAVRLVIIHPERTHKRGSRESEAMEFARDATRNYGNVARKHPNMLVFLAADADKMTELSDAARDFCAWRDVERDVEVMNLSAFEQRMVGERRKRASQVVDQLVGETYIWTLVPDQPDGGRPAVMTAVRTDSSTAGLVQRVSDKLLRDGKLADRHAPQNIRYVLREKLSGIWEARSSIPVGELWNLYTRYTYMPRLRDRTVLVTGIRDVLELRSWVTDGFALATSSQDGRFEGLTIPGAGAVFGEITDGTLLVVPERALAQRSGETPPPPSGEHGPAGAAAQGREVGGTGTSPSSGTREPSRFFGVVKIGGDRYGKAFKDLQLEILPHLDDPETELEITVEIRARRDGGFGEEKRRIVSENAEVLKFEQADFER
jgi:Protein of unknown function (DUF499)